MTSVFNAMNAYQCAWRNTGNRPGLAGPLGMDGVWPWARSVPEQYSGLPAVQVRVRKCWRIEQLGAADEKRAKMAAGTAKSRELLHCHKLSSTQDVTLSLTPQEASSSCTVTLADSITA